MTQIPNSKIVTFIMTNNRENSKLFYQSILGLEWESDDNFGTIFKLKNASLRITEGFGQDSLGIQHSPDGKTKLAWLKDTDGNVLCLMEKKESKQDFGFFKIYIIKHYFWLSSLGRQFPSSRIVIYDKSFGIVEDKNDWFE